MMVREYLLDANIVITIWSRYPELFDIIEKDRWVNFNISESIAKELCKKEFKEVNGTPVLSNKFLKLLNHIVNDEVHDINKNNKNHIKIKYNYKNKFYFINGSKISSNDYNLICICEKNEKYTLVTGDKNILKSAVSILGPSKVMNFESFIEDLKKNEILIEDN